MDEQQKLVSHVPSRIERLSAEVQSSAYHRALTRISHGLILFCFSLDIGQLKLFSTWLGQLLIAAGLYTLHPFNNRLAIAWRTASVRLAVLSVLFWLTALPDSGLFCLLTQVLNVASTYPLPLLMMYFLFFGLSDTAKDLERDLLAEQLQNCFRVYLVLYVVISIFPPNRITSGTIGTLILLPVYILVVWALARLPYKVSELNDHPSPSPVSAKPINRREKFVLAAYLAATLCGSAAFQYLANAPIPASETYVNVPAPETHAARERMLSFGLPDYIVSDLPDEEIEKLADFHRATTEITSSIMTTNQDGGDLEIVSFTAVMPDGLVRVLFCYRWLQPPDHTYVDMLSVPVNVGREHTNSPEEVISLSGFSLYEKNGIVYKHDPLNENNRLILLDSTQDQYLAYTAVNKFRLFPGFVNQRGYIALNISASYPDIDYNFVIPAAYIHQVSMWNRPYTDPLEYSWPPMSSGVPFYEYEDSKIFKQEDFSIRVHHSPGELDP